MAERKDRHTPSDASREVKHDKPRDPERKRERKSGAASEGISGEDGKQSLRDCWRKFRFVNTDRRIMNLRDSGLLTRPLVGLYFSASWCPPCRKFTPKLNAFWKTVQDQLSLVLVSRDVSDPSAFYDYLAKMEFGVALSFKSEHADALAHQYGVDHIPCLVIIDTISGKLLTKKGREDVESLESKATTHWKQAIPSLPSHSSSSSPPPHVYSPSSTC